MKKRVKKNIRKNVLWVLFLFTALGTLHALEVGGDFRIGNLALNQIKNPSVTTFNGNDFSSWGLSFYGSHNVTDSLRIDTGFFSDPILKNISYTLFSYTESILKLGVGPFFGFFNADLNTLLKSGISTNIKVELPGILFLDFRTDSSLASRLVIEGDYIQERTDLSFGFYVPNAICYVNLFSKRFTQKVGAYEVLDSLNEYSFKTHLYQKMIPYRATINLAYQVLGKRFINDPATTEYLLNSIIVGTKLDIDLTSYLIMTIDMENSIYTFGQGELLGTSNPGPGSYAFRGSVGVKVNIDKLLQKSKMQEEFEEIAASENSERGDDGNS